MVAKKQKQKRCITRTGALWFNFSLVSHLTRQLLINRTILLSKCHKQADTNKWRSERQEIDNNQDVDL